MLDFSSSLYLGMRHPAQAIRPWAQLTLGKPTALKEPATQIRLAQRLASLTGSESALLGSSTLHLFWDLFGVLSKSKVEIFLDGGAYPIARWGIQRADSLGTPVRQFVHYNPQQLDRTLAARGKQQRKPVVVCDGFCPGCGKPAPLDAYLAIVRKYNGYLVLDDTQSLGILGREPTRNRPYGTGGGGLLHWHSTYGPELIVVNSLAKGFGVPVAMLAGNAKLIAHFDRHSETRVHCSPPSIAVIHAAEHALNQNEQEGDALRKRLAGNVQLFRTGLADARWKTSGGIFPVQTLQPTPQIHSQVLYEKLRRQGIYTVLHQANGEQPACISFILTARHTPQDIGQALAAIENATGKSKQPLEKDYGNRLSVRKNTGLASTRSW